MTTIQNKRRVVPAYLLRAALHYIPHDGVEERDLREAIEDTLAAAENPELDALLVEREHLRRALATIADAGICGPLAIADMASVKAAARGALACPSTPDKGAL